MTRMSLEIVFISAATDLTPKVCCFSGEIMTCGFAVSIGCVCLESELGLSNLCHQTAAPINIAIIGKLRKIHFLFMDSTPVPDRYSQARKELRSIFRFL